MKVIKILLFFLLPLIDRFNASDFLERLRGKRLMLVGDSMNRNQFESLLCLLREGLANKSRMYETRGRKITKGRGQYVFKFQVNPNFIHIFFLNIRVGAIVFMFYQNILSSF